MKKIIILGSLVLVSGFFLSGCTKKVENGDVSENFDKDSCYEECIRFGGGDEAVEMCQENCDASFDEGSVWNEDQEKYHEDDAVSKAEWPSDMPTEVPMFEYGMVTGSIEGMNSWIVDFEDVDDDALEQYASDLEAEGWSASVMSVNNSLTGKYESDYSITMNHDKEYETLQMIVREAN